MKWVFFIIIFFLDHDWKGSVWENWVWDFDFGHDDSGLSVCNFVFFFICRLLFLYLISFLTVLTEKSDFFGCFSSRFCVLISIPSVSRMKYWRNGNFFVLLPALCMKKIESLLEKMVVWMQLWDY